MYHIVFLAELTRKDFTYSVMHCGSYHVIQRANILQDVLELYRSNQELLKEYTFQVKFFGEKALDLGGVSKDMFSAFFLAIYQMLFDGASLLQPCINVGTDIEAFRVLGAVFSHAYLCCGILPDRVAFPCLAAAFLGPGVKIPHALLQHYYLYSLSTYEGDALKNAMT